MDDNIVVKRARLSGLKSCLCYLLVCSLFTSFGQVIECCVSVSSAIKWDGKHTYLTSCEI